MSTPARFSDGQYKNWLKCSQSLIVMKEALHDYIDNEVKNLHSNITLKVSSIPCGTSTGNHCGSCSWKGIKLTGGRHGTWYINCKSSICDKWLHEILAVHDDPHNPTINWKNADISKWSIDCYHVAKIFMPKGQDKTTKMPEDLDAPAILSLMKYCSWFRKDLSNTQILSDLIDIRNKVLHSGDLRVADSDKDSWIDLMIQLLSDLKINSDAQAELKMLKREDIDIDFRASEIRVFQRMVNDLESELTTLKEDMISLQDFQSELSKEMTRLRDNTETTTKVDTIEADVKEMRQSLHELRNISDKMVSFFDQNPDIHDIKITETIRNICRDVQDQQQILLRVETELSAKVSSLEMQMNKFQEETKKQLEAVEKRLTAVMEQKENGDDPLQNLESPRKKRPESDGLKQLKNQTEDKLDTLRRLECIPTEQAENAKKLLEKKRAIVIKGHPGEGKTTTALQLIDTEMYRYRRVVLNYPQDWKTVDTDWVAIVILDDIFGQFDLDSGHFQEWMMYLPTIQEHVDAGKLWVIITTRTDILSKAYSKLGSLKLFSDDSSLTLSSELLNNLEKISILNRQLQRHGKIMWQNEKRCIANFSGLIGFPQCCSLFAGDCKSFDRGPGFFRSPEKFFIANITELQDTRFLSLAFLFCNGEIWEEHLSPETMPETSKHLLMELASYLDISKKEASITLLRDAYDSFLDLYVVKSMSCFSLETPVKKSCLHFAHATVCEAVGHVLGERCVEMVVKYGSSEYLYQRTYITKVKDDTSQNVFISESVYGLLAERMVHDVVKSGLLRSFVEYSALKQINFVMALKNELHKGKVIKDFFTVYDTNTYLPVHDLFVRKCNTFETFDNALNGKCMTFMQLILQSDEDVVSLVYGQLLEFLECAHTNNTPDCWQCIEKQKLLQLALCNHHFWIAEKLVTMNACYTHANLYNAARQGDLGRVQSILETLKRSQVFSAGCMEATRALWEAFRSGNQRLKQMLVKEGIILDSKHVVHAVNDGDMNVLMKVVEHLKYHKKWRPHQEEHTTFTYDLTYLRYASQYDTPCISALYISYHNEKFDMTDYLLKNEVKISMRMLASVAGDCSKQAVDRVIQNLKDSDKWNPKCYDASKALKNAYKRQEEDVSDLLVQERFSLRMKNLSNLISTFHVSLETVKKAIEHMKDTQNWDPKCDEASEALINAYQYHYDVCDLLLQEGISPAMKILPKLTCLVSLKTVKKAIQHLKDTQNWDPKCKDAYEALENAYASYDQQSCDVCDLLVQEGVSPAMKILPKLTSKYCKSLQTVKKAIQHLKDTKNWDPMCDDAFIALENAYTYQKENCDVCDLLVQEGVSPAMKILPKLTSKYCKSLQTVKKAIQHLKDTKIWDPMCDDAFIALENAYTYQKENCDVCDLLVQEGVSPAMKILPKLTSKYCKSLQTVKKAIQHLKDTKNWDPMCDDAFIALENAYTYQKENCDVCDLLVQEGVSPAMKILPKLTCLVSLVTVKKAIQHLKDTQNWDPKCKDAYEALENAYASYDQQSCDVCDLLVQEGVSPAMKILPKMTSKYCKSLQTVKKAIQHLKDTKNWDPMCDDAFIALENAYTYQKENCDVCDLLVQEGVSPAMKILPKLTCLVSLVTVKKAIQHLKDTKNWDPKCHDAFKALENASCKKKYSKYHENLHHLLVQEGISQRKMCMIC